MAGGLRGVAQGPCQRLGARNDGKVGLRVLPKPGRSFFTICRKLQTLQRGVGAPWMAPSRQARSDG